MRYGGASLLSVALFLSCAEPQPGPTQALKPVPADTLFVSVLTDRSVAVVGDTLTVSALLEVGRDSVKVVHARWSALDPAIVEVDSTGLVTALAPGTGRVQATVGSHQSAVSVTVLERALGSVASENKLPGTADWFTKPYQWASPSKLAMWASPYSAGPSDTMEVFIHSTAGRVTLSLFRLGWYGGLGGRLLWKAQNVAAFPQPACGAPDATGPVSCRWSRATQIPIDPTWVNGVYLLKATTADGGIAYYPFVVHAVSRAAFIAIVPLFTWQAYNAWGGTSLYTPQGHAVSFERPYDIGGGSAYVLQDSYSWDLSVLRWLEANDIDVAYESDADLQPASVGPAPLKGLIFIGHSEYWTWAEFDRVQQLRDSHKHLAFLSGNNAYWNVRLSSGSVTGRPAQVVSCFKLDPDPGSTSVRDLTKRFRDSPLNRPENGLYGIMYSEGTDGIFPLVAAAPPEGSEAAAFLAAAGIPAGDSIPSGAGNEGDVPFANGFGPANLQMLFRSPFIPRTLPSPYDHAFYTTFFVAPSGAGVFAAGNNRFSRGLQSVYSSPEPRIQKLFKAILDWMMAS